MHTVTYSNLEITGLNWYTKYIQKETQAAITCLKLDSHLPCFICFNKSPFKNDEK